MAQHAGPSVTVSPAIGVAVVGRRCNTHVHMGVTVMAVTAAITGGQYDGYGRRAAQAGKNPFTWHGLCF